MAVIIHTHRDLPKNNDDCSHARKKSSVQQSKATERGLALLARQVRNAEEKKHINPFELLSQLNQPDLQKQVEIQAPVIAATDVNQQEVGDDNEKDEEKEEECKDVDAFTSNTSYLPLAALTIPAANLASSQTWSAADPMTESRMQQLQSLLLQMASQISVNSKRSEFIVTLDPALFADTQLKIQVNEDGMSVEYSCECAAETTWFGNHAPELTKRLSTTLKCPVKIQSAQRWPTASES